MKMTQPIQVIPSLFLFKYLLIVVIEGEDETVSFIDLQHNNLKLPEKKGILKKHDYGLVMSDGKDSWGDASPDDILSQNNISMAQLMGATSMTDVERTLKSLNGYHEDIIKALRTAANHRGASTPSGSTSCLSEEVLRRSLQECAAGYGDYKRSSKENVCEPQVSLTCALPREPVLDE